MTSKESSHFKKSSTFGQASQSNGSKSPYIGKLDSNAILSGGEFKQRNLLDFLRQLNVDEKYIDIQIANNYQFEEIESLSEEEFARKFDAQTEEEANVLSEILLKLKSLTLPESYEINRNFSLSVSEDQEGSSKKSRVLTGTFHESSSGRNKSSITTSTAGNLDNIKKSNQEFGRGHFSTFNHFDTQSQYVYDHDNQITDSISQQHKLLIQKQQQSLYEQQKQYQKVKESKNQHVSSQVSSLHVKAAFNQNSLLALGSKLSETIFFQPKQLPYDPFYTSYQQISSSSNNLKLLSNSFHKNQTLHSGGEPFSVSNTLMQASSLNGITSVLKQVARQVTKKLSVTEKLNYENLAQPYLYLRVSEKEQGVITNFCRVLLGGEKLTIGRNQVNSLCLTKASVSRFHAVIEATDGSYWLTDVGSGQGTFVRIPKKEQQLIEFGTSFKCGATEFQVMEINKEEGFIGIVVNIVAGNKKNEKTDFNVILQPQKPVFIGTSSLCGINAIDFEMESFHACIIACGDQLFLEDRSLSQTTWVRLSASRENSQPLLLHDGQAILIGPYLLTAHFQF